MRPPACTIGSCSQNDRAAEAVSREAQLLSQWRVHHISIAAYHPNCLGVLHSAIDHVFRRACSNHMKNVRWLERGFRLVWTQQW